MQTAVLYTTTKLNKSPGCKCIRSYVYASATHNLSYIQHARAPGPATTVELESVGPNPISVPAPSETSTV